METAGLVFITHHIVLSNDAFLLYFYLTVFEYLFSFLISARLMMIVEPGSIVSHAHLGIQALGV